MKRAQLCLLTFLIAVPAWARDANPIAPSNLYGFGHFAAEAQLGLGTPVGVAGLLLDADVHRDVSISLGGGIGFGSQLGALLRYRRGRVPMRWGLAIGATRGNAGDRFTDWMAGNPTYGAHWNPGWWANVEFFIETRYETGWRWRCSIGGTAVVNVTDCVWQSTDRLNGEHCSKSLPLPYLGCAIGIGR